MIRILHSALRVAAARLALVAMLCFVLQGALAHAIGHSHSHDGHARYHHSHADHSSGFAAHAHGTVDHSDADVGDTDRPDSGTTAHFDWTCCGSTACTAVMLTAAAVVALCSIETAMVTACRSPPVLGFIGDGPRRPPRFSVLA